MLYVCEHNSWAANTSAKMTHAAENMSDRAAGYGIPAKVVDGNDVLAVYEAAGEAVAFNSLSAWADDPEAGEYYADPLEVTAFCRTLTPWVAMRHDYHGRDFTCYLYKNRRP